MARCAQSGCYDRDEVNVCWIPRLTNKNTSINKSTQGTATLASIPANTMVCLQSTRNPTCTSNPPQRPANAYGYVWAYYRDAGGSVYTGWIYSGDIGAAAGGPCSGPALADWQCGGTPVGCTDTVGCADRNDSFTVSVDSYLRYAPGSTAWQWVGKDAGVNRKGYSTASGYACVVVTSNPKYCDAGVVGWIEQGNLH